MTTGKAQPVAATQAPTAAPTTLLDIAQALHRLARRYAVGQSPSAADALLYDASMNILAGKADDPQAWRTRLVPTATHDRYVRRGPEQVRETFSLPATTEDAVVILHRYARRYANGRGTFTAPVVNDAARALQRLGVDLSRTAELDGTIWAADGADGVYDGLAPDVRDEALRSAMAAARAGDDG